MIYDRFNRTLENELAANSANLPGFRFLTEEGLRRGTPINQLSYILATAFWETARRMKPVREAFFVGSNEQAAENWRRANLSYYPYYGRGYVQLTHRDNYQRAGDALGENLVDNLDRALDPEVSRAVLFEGMEHGWFTGKKLDDYIDELDESEAADFEEYRRARRIVNGTDKDETIAAIAVKLEDALRDAGYPAGAATAPASPTAGGDSFEDLIQGLGLRHFKAYEFLVKGNAHKNPDSPAFGLNTDPPRHLWPNIAQTARALDAVRQRLQVPIVPTSVYRSPAYNTAIGGAKRSRHMEFDAIDFVAQGSTVGPVEWAEVARQVRDDGIFTGGIGVYSSFVHIDNRGTVANW